jgi:hypothetical protein
MEDLYEIYGDNHQVTQTDLELLKRLTNRQKKIAQLLATGKTRKQIAFELRVSLQAVHQIVLRMRQRYGEKPLNFYQKRERIVEFYRSLIFAGLLMHPEFYPEDIYENWLTDTFLKEYTRPPLMLIKKIYKEFGI